MTQETEKLQQVLSKLKDIHYPDTAALWPPSEILWWPPAPGIMLILIIILCIIIYLSIKIVKKIKQFYTNRKIKIALSELHSIEQNINAENFITCIQQISFLLKRCAMVKYRAQNIQSLSGNQWLEFLNTSGNTDKFTSNAGLLMTTVPYLNNIEFTDKFKQDINNLIKISKNWIKHNL